MALKRMVLLMFTCIYSMAAVGMPVHYHFCQGELETMSVFNPATCGEQEAVQNDAGCCSQKVTHTPCSVSDTEDACCTSESSLIQLDTQVGATQENWVSDSVAMLVNFTPAGVYSPLVRPCDRDAREDILRVGKYLLHQALLYYG